MHLWIIPLLPLVGAGINGLLGKRFPKALVNTIALGFDRRGVLHGVVGGGPVLGPAGRSDPHIEHYATWLSVGSFSVDYGMYLDQLSLIMLLVVTGVGFLIHIYSVGYMEHEGGYYRYFAYLNIFMFFMLTLVLANNYLLMLSDGKVWAWRRTCSLASGSEEERRRCRQEGIHYQPRWRFRLPDRASSCLMKHFGTLQ